MMTSVYTRLVLLQMMFCFAVMAEFPQNAIPLTRSNISDFTKGMQYFTGDSETPLDGVNLVQRLTVDGREYIIVTGNSVVFFLDAKKQQEDGGPLQINQKLIWKDIKGDKCKRFGICYDHILIALAFDRKDIGRRLFMCATGRKANPLCRVYNATRNETTDQLSFSINYKTDSLHSLASRAYLPPRIHGKVTHLISTDGKLYTTSFMDEFSGMPVIANNPLYNLMQLRREFAHRTIQQESKKTTTKDYVDSHELSDRILFFTNEKENIHTNEVHHAIEVQSICKNDPGYVISGSTVYTQNFVKTRMSCRGLEYITGVSFPPKWQYPNEEDIIFYATFASEEDELPASAVCSFRVGDVLEALKGSFLSLGKDDTDYNERLSKVPDEHPGKCLPFNTTNTMKWNKEKSQHTLIFGVITGKLLMTDRQERFSSLVMRYDVGPYRNMTMMYIGTEEGNLLRVMPPTADWSNAVIIEKIDAFNKEQCSNPNNSSNWTRDREVRFLKFDEQTKNLQIGLRNCVIFKPIYSCSQYACNSACIGSGDPECGWRGSSGKCVEYLTGAQQLEQNLSDAIKRPQLYPACPIPTTPPPTTVAPALITGSLIDLSSSPVGGLDSDGKTGNVKTAQASYPKMLLVLIVIVSIVGTIIILFSIMCCCRCSRTKEPVDFGQKQLRLQQSEMKHQSRPGGNSSTWMQRLLCKCDVWGLGWSAGSKRNSPIGGSPVMSYKEDRDTLINRSSGGQDYSETPTLPMVTRQGSQRQNQMAVRQEEARRQRHASSRHDSTSSVTSRRSNFNMEMKVLGRTHSTSTQHSDIHCNSIPRSDPRAIPSYQTSSSSSSSRKDSPPVFHENGAAECGVLPTASAKMRRRNERRASRVTNEIMRDSHDAVQQFENVYHSMIQNGFGSGTTPTPQHPHHLRQRLDSDDSGKGASPRNSLQNDMEQATVIDGRQVRPSSLHLGRPQQFRRPRLVSEPTYEIQMTPMRPGSIVKVAAGSPSRAYPQPQFIFAATSNKQPPHPQDPRGAGVMRGMSMRSHPSTPTNPNGGAFIPYQHQMATSQQQQQQQQQQQASYPAYATLPKQQSAAMVTGQRPRTRHMSGNLPYQQVQMQPLLQDHQHPIAQAPRMTATAAPSSNGGIPNRYPSMMVRGTHANIKSFQPRQGAQQQQQQQRQHTVANTVMTTAAQNYYPSMPMQVAGESGKNDGSMEFKMVRRPDHLPVLVRQSSTSSSNGSSYHNGPVPAFETV